MSRIPFTPKQRFEVLSRDNHTCQYCGARAPNVQLVVDHIIPVSRGGTNASSNLISACFSCNAGKADSPPDPELPVRHELRLLVDRFDRQFPPRFARREATDGTIAMLAAAGLLKQSLRWIADSGEPTWEQWVYFSWHLLERQATKCARSVYRLLEDQQIWPPEMRPITADSELPASEVH